MSTLEPRPTSKALVIATHNQGKVREIETLLAGSGWDVRSLDPEVPEVPETGTTFAANARAKALYYAGHTGMAALADDSGLEIDALGGEPGVRSARYVHPDLSPAQRNLEILARLRDLPARDRGARFVCHLVLAMPDKVVHETTGTCGGRIAGSATRSRPWRPSVTPSATQ